MKEIIKHLLLEAHVEGGYFRQTHQTEQQLETKNGKRFLMNSIYYLLTSESHIGYFHRGRYDITHFYHLGAPMHYLLLSPEGDYSKATLGPDSGAREVLSFTVPGGWWKSSFISKDDDYSLISEVVSPGFDFADHEMATREYFLKHFPKHYDRLQEFIRS
jgi:hypothetical protein|tara:strand:- start:318 stop:797 length:480 start_codon:yes stop_codon:yes gene_type:complete